jgi:hypothetical protein
VILALSGPTLFASKSSQAKGPLVLIVDNGWAAAHDWSQRQNTLYGLIDGAERSSRPIVLVATAPTRRSGPTLSLLSAEEARRTVDSLVPTAWEVDRVGALERLKRETANLLSQDPEFIWLTNSLDPESATDFANGLLDLGHLKIAKPSGQKDLLVLAEPTVRSDGFSLTLHRPFAGPATTKQISIGAENGQVLSISDVEFGAGERKQETAVKLPLELRNKTQRIEIMGQRSASSIALLDERWRRRSVGIATSQRDIDKPLLSEIYYNDRALSPYTEIRKGSLKELLKAQVSVLLLSDIGQLPEDIHYNLSKWVQQGGTLVRFAGPRLINNSDGLVPVTLRQGGRALGGALSWDEPQALGPFPETSPFFGLDIPKDVTVSRQVLAEPSMELANRTWAQLSDGTPLVTAKQQGDGWLILFHITANAEWSTLPMSGLYVDMLRKIVALSNAKQVTASADVDHTHLSPQQILDGFGQLQKPALDLKAIEPKLKSWRPNPHQPPGLYGHRKNLSSFNLHAATVSLTPVTEWPSQATIIGAQDSRFTDLAPWLLGLAFALALLDGLIILYLTGKLAWRPSSSRTPAIQALVLFSSVIVMAGMPTATQAASSTDKRAIEAALVTRLAYVSTGNAKLDAMSRAGLTGLTRSLKRRTAAEPGTPMVIDLETDELAFFPLIYWPIHVDQPPLSDNAIAKLNRYMKTGGTLIFDTADQHQSISNFEGQSARTTPNGRRLRKILQRLDTPPLVPIPTDHVLTRSFYLLREFPGKWTGGTLWIEGTLQDDGQRALNDGVSSIIIGSNDWATAWAIDPSGQPLAPLVPGGPRQREFATRFGINLVMYTLTGNYKSDQVHLPALLERLGQ